MNLDSNGLEVLDRAECLALMGSVQLGRLVFTDRALPAIQPVNFVLDGEQIVIRSSSGSKLAAATRHAIVAFEVDAFDGDGRTGWSVTVVGQAQAVTDPVRLQQVHRLPLRPWSPGVRDHFISISAEQVSGRRIHHSGPVRAHDDGGRGARAGAAAAAGPDGPASDAASASAAASTVAATDGRGPGDGASGRAAANSDDAERVA